MIRHARVGVWVSLFLLSCVVTPLDALAQAKSRLYFVPDQATLNVGESVNLEVWVRVGDNIPESAPYKAVQAEIKWNRDVANTSSVTHHISFWTGPFCGSDFSILKSQHFANPGRALVSQLSTPDDPRCGNTRVPFKMFTLPYTAVAPGQTEVYFAQFSRLIFETSPVLVEDLDFDTFSSIITVLGPTPTPPPPMRCVCPMEPAPGDFDNDGIPDVVEYDPDSGAPQSTSNMYLWDSDGDGLSDGAEDINANGLVNAGETNPMNRDTDGDGIWDGIEVHFLNSDPLDPLSPGFVVDADNDGLPASLDPDDNNPDVDGDRFTDGIEAVYCGLDAVTDAGLFPPLGDVDCQDGVTNLDALIIQSLFVGTLPRGSLPGEVNADVNRDGIADNVDSLMIFRWFLGSQPVLPFPTF